LQKHIHGCRKDKPRSGKIQKNSPQTKQTALFPLAAVPSESQACDAPTDFCCPFRHDTDFTGLQRFVVHHPNVNSQEGKTMLRKSLLGLLVVLALIVLYLLGWPVSVEPVA